MASKWCALGGILRGLSSGSSGVTVAVDEGSVSADEQWGEVCLLCCVWCQKHKFGFSKKVHFYVPFSLHNLYA